MIFRVNKININFINLIIKNKLHNCEYYDNLLEPDTTKYEKIILNYFKIFNIIFSNENYLDLEYYIEKMIMELCELYYIGDISTEVKNILYKKKITNDLIDIMFGFTQGNYEFMRIKSRMIHNNNKSPGSNGDVDCYYPGSVM